MGGAGRVDLVEFFLTDPKLVGARVVVEGWVGEGGGEGRPPIITPSLERRMEWGGWRKRVSGCIIKPVWGFGETTFPVLNLHHRWTCVKEAH